MKKAGNPTFPKKKDETTEAPNGIEKKRMKKKMRCFVDRLIKSQISVIFNEEISKEHLQSSRNQSRNQCFQGEMIKTEIFDTLSKVVQA